ncbi:primary-amine oxidase [Nesterenkonia aurantiaca]|uniref:Amine oxidase n=1 Tax=Nesterenkonia aurantiaca TaxID=1436010 RepID=A0A4R7G8K0_9MICC|nr:primary-amine oxidase [Nesterenkonia aurantiaca]TDS87777.1 primary-amine oxidase [Nesterenkonia aurantiaca]
MNPQAAQTAVKSLTATHPLEPLAPEEISKASAILKQHSEFTPEQRFVFIELREPSKATVRAFEAEAGPWEREAFLLLRDHDRHRTLEAIVNLSTDAVTSYLEIEDAQPPMTEEEFFACEEMIRQDPQVQQALRRRGVEDFSKAMVDKWAAGYVMAEDAPSQRRIARPIVFIQGEDDANAYARPVENLIITVDLDSNEILEVKDTGVVPLPQRKGNYTADRITDPENSPHFEKVRDRMKPIHITQPEGPSFTMQGNGLEWANWNLRVGFTAREGVVLHNITYDDRGTERPVLYRASLAEMYVPYGDPGDTHWNKNVFDEGEYGLGGLANSLVLGCDCLGEITYLDAHLCDQDGEPTKISNAICIHEEDSGIGWKHTDFRTGLGEVRRNRRLVVSYFTTVGNYDYGFYWYLYLDGSIEFESKLTGILSTGAYEQGDEPKYGKVIAEGLYGPNHQHFFAVRLDMNVDGPKNNLYELQAEAAAPEDNPWGNAWYESKTLLRSEAEAQRLADPTRGRSWVVTNAEKKNRLGGDIGYKVELGGSLALPMAQPGSQQYARGAFARRHLWATKFAERERYAAGEYVPQNPSSGGLPEYVQQDRSLVGEDLVLWPVLCAHHVVRPEDWPVMPVATVGLHLKPSGFFDGNPMLDLPAEQSSSCH